MQLHYSLVIVTQPSAAKTQNSGHHHHVKQIEPVEKCKSVFATMIPRIIPKQRQTTKVTTVRRTNPECLKDHVWPMKEMASLAAIGLKHAHRASFTETYNILVSLTAAPRGSI
ncbi:unnamed protein product, partial [Ectocarpus fasciculatus]